jgi:hypothetical protein
MGLSEMVAEASVLVDTAVFALVLTQALALMQTPTPHARAERRVYLLGHLPDKAVEAAPNYPHHSHGGALFYRLPDEILSAGHPPFVGLDGDLQQPR